MTNATATTTKPVSRLAALYGAPTPIRTSNVTRFNPEYFRAEVKCPTCGVWQRKEHNSFCYYCNIWLVEQPAPATAVTPEPARLEQVQEVTTAELVVVAENATEATPEPDEQDVLIAKLAFEAGAEVDRERYFAARSGKYVLLHQRADGLAVNCSCPDRVKKGRFQGRACKHMTAHNTMLAPAKKQQQEAA